MFVFNYFFKLCFMFTVACTALCKICLKKVLYKQKLTLHFPPLSSPPPLSLSHTHKLFLCFYSISLSSLSSLILTIIVFVTLPPDIFFPSSFSFHSPQFFQCSATCHFFFMLILPFLSLPPPPPPVFPYPHSYISPSSLLPQTHFYSRVIRPFRFLSPNPFLPLLHFFSPPSYVFIFHTSPSPPPPPSPPPSLPPLSPSLSSL